jgi:hypothetical protein
MGLSSSSKTSDQTAAYAPQLLSSASNVTNAYNANAPKIQGYADQVGSLVPSLLGKYQAGNPAINAQQDYITGMLGHAPGQNPQLDQLLQTSDAAIGNQTAAALGTRGISPAGSVAHDVVSRNIAQNDTQARYQDYNQQQQLQAQAAGMAPSNAAGDVIGIAPLLSAAGTASGLPLDAATQQAAGIGGLLGRYTNTKETSTPSMLDSFGKVLDVANSVVGMVKSDRRLKEDIRRIGKTDGGLPVYIYRYKGGNQLHMGVMAQEVAELQPKAVGPEFHGFGTVNYEELR